MTEPRQIDVRDQAKLSYAKIFELVRSGITHRLLRSTLTMSVILLAVAFFMFSLAESSIINAVNNGVQAEITVQRRTPHLLSHITAKPTPSQLAARLARLSTNEAARAELSSVTGWEPARIATVIDQAVAEQRYLHFFRTVSPGKRIAMVDKAKDRQIFTDLTNDKAWKRFEEQLAAMPELRLPTEVSAFNDFVVGYADYSKELGQLVGAWNGKVAALATVVDGMRGDQRLERWLVTTSDEEFNAWSQAVRDLGFKPKDDTLAHMRQDLTISLRLQDIQQELKTQAKQDQWLKVFRFRAKMGEKLDMLGDERLREQILEGKYTAEQLDEVMAYRAYERKLADLEASLSPVIGSAQADGGLLSNRQVFLLAISFVVCMVGIANAMLMAITERFREIATMKCLGATDHFILIQFMMEAGIQGVAGGVLGMIIGFALTFLKMIALYGGYPIVYFPFMPVLTCAIFSLLTGILLAIVASIYPSYSASRMAPMEAMRIE